MGQRLKFGLGTAAVLAATVGVLAPQATAEELAPGLSCEKNTCRNDTDDMYRVEVAVTCWNGTYTTTRYVAEHSTRFLDDFGCAPRQEPGHWEHRPDRMGPDGKWEHQPSEFEPGRFIPQHPTKIEYLSAVVDNDPQPAPSSGSAGS
ncbi:hypothetical protein [Nocardia transvalensis]|uniref:hypothetical protein n=1 Tax=Nocardia transvalensis TaxID=37333 RepID=UPI001894E3B3|nr:hypothetical protein [Nocardia transvalensis]MBF6328547.1 hypothetical protein [Nocardia transvalensis]